MKKSRSVGKEEKAGAIHTCGQSCGGSLGIVCPRNDMAYARRRGPAVPADVRAIEVLGALACRFREGRACDRSRDALSLSNGGGPAAGGMAENQPVGEDRPEDTLAPGGP